MLLTFDSFVECCRSEKAVKCQEVLPAFKREKVVARDCVITGCRQVTGLLATFPSHRSPGHPESLYFASRTVPRRQWILRCVNAYNHRMNIDN